MSRLFCLLEKKLKFEKNFEIIKIGFSWRAFFFTYIWGFSNEIWDHSLIWFGFSVLFALSYFFSYITGLELFFLTFLISFYWGLFGSNILINNLIEKKRFLPQKLVLSSSASEALLIYLSEK